MKTAALLLCAIFVLPLVADAETIHGCYKDRKKHDGFVRIVEGPGQCKQNEYELSWNIEGEPGAQGGSPFKVIVSN